MLRYPVGVTDIRLTNDMNSIAISRLARPKVQYAVQTRSESIAPHLQAIGLPPSGAVACDGQDLIQPRMDPERNVGILKPHRS